MFSLAQLAQVVREADPSLTFNTLEVGAFPLEGEVEPAHQLLDVFPGTRIVAIELDKELCERLNRTARPGLHYYPVALGRAEETRALYETACSVATSLYEPNTALLECFNFLEVAKLRAVSSVTTVTLDRFAADHGLGQIDFVKIDVQGAELDIFAGGARTLADVSCIVSEVEFIPLYVGQPLMGEVCSYLSQRGMMFHKFLEAGGRTMKLGSVQDNSNIAVQLLWADAMFVPEVVSLKSAAPQRLLRLAVLAFLYQSPDLTLFCLEIYDRRWGTRLVDQLLTRPR